MTSYSNLLSSPVLFFSRFLSISAHILYTCSQARYSCCVKSTCIMLHQMQSKMVQTVCRYFFCKIMTLLTNLQCLIDSKFVKYETSLHKEEETYYQGVISIVGKHKIFTLELQYLKCPLPNAHYSFQYSLQCPLLPNLLEYHEFFSCPPITCCKQSKKSLCSLLSQHWTTIHQKYDGYCISALIAFTILTRLCKKCICDSDEVIKLRLEAKDLLQMQNNIKMNLSAHSFVIT